MQDSVKIIDRVYVLACDEAGSGGLGSVVIRNDRIHAIGPVNHAFQVQFPQAERIDGTGKVLLPGFIDAHYHGESSLLHILTAGSPVSKWPRLPRYRAMDEALRTTATYEDWLALYRSAYYAALRAGVTTLAEFGRPDTDTAFAACVAAFRAVSLRGMLAIHNGDQLEASRSVRSPSMAFSMALSSSEELTTYNLQTTMRLARDHRLPVTVHIGETGRDAESIRKNFRKTYVDLLAEYQVFSSTCLPVHFSILNDDDLLLLKRAGSRIAVAPLAAAMKGFELPPLEALAEAGVEAVLGTDWGPVRPWQALRKAAQQLSVPAMDLLHMHTSGAARYLGVGQELGRVAPGMKADLLMVRSPFADVRAVLNDLGPSMVAELLLHRASESDVSDVMVNGEFYVREGNILMYAEEDLHNDLRRLLALAPAEEQPKVPTVPSAAETPSEDVGHAEDSTHEEGFRIVHRSPAPRPAGPILPLTPPGAPGRELPPNVRRVFGDEDV
ncbi:MAG: amidohydrolase family protein [Bacteroidota bacterium]